MRWMVLALVALLAGCLETTENDDGGDEAPVCGTSQYTYWFEAGLRLRTGEPPAAGEVFSNGFDEAFQTDDMDVWLSFPLEEGLLIEGDMTLEYWVRNDGTPAPVVSTTTPTDGYHWFNQVGTDQTFVEDFGREYSDAVPEAGSVDHYVQTIAMPEGGLVVEPGDRLRILLTSLVVDDGMGRGQHILFGGDTPSSLSFGATCWDAPVWDETASSRHSVVVEGNQGLITGAIPATGGVNYAEQPFTLKPETDRLTISLTQTDDQNPQKDDMDLTIHDATGTEVWSIGSPFADESGRLWRANLDAFMPPGTYTVRVNSYSGVDYHGDLLIVQDIAT